MSSRGTVLLQVLMAAVFLAVIGGSIGLALGLRDHDDNQGRGGTTTQEQPPASPAPDAQPCEPEIAQEARDNGAEGDLAQVLYVQTTGSEVWICRDGRGGLYYQGHRGSPADRPIQPEGTNWLFLTGVRQTADGYQVANKDHIYRVNRQQLTIVYPDGREEEELAVS